MYDVVEMVVELIFANDLISHGHTQRLHRVSEGVVISADHLVAKVNHLLFSCHPIIITKQPSK